MNDTDDVKVKDPEAKNTDDADIKEPEAKKTDDSEAKEPETKKEPEDVKKSEENLELAGLSFKEKLKVKRERYKEYTAEMSGKEKFSYFLYYYKGTVLLSIIILFCAIALPVSIYKNTRPIALSYAVINNYSIEKPNEEPIKEYQRYYNITKGYQIRSNTSFYLDLEEYESGNLSENDMTSYEQFPTLCYNGYFDIVISDIKGIEFCLNANLIQPLGNIFTDDMLDELSDKYPGVLLGSTSENNRGYYIDISDTDFAKELKLSYEDIYICFPANEDKSNTNSRRVIKFIFNLDSPI